MQTNINGTSYEISEYADGWAWTSKADESAFAFPSACEALQNAMDYERMIIRDRDEESAQQLQDEIYGTFEKQMNKLYYGTRL